ncbi:glucose-6-phosphate isomerase [Methanocaldococcus bathoardescens]|uniref:Probable glucose-6-phosphate isomerase n=1 Tax=Methanocaldococcus bathoardescens TaxID=1301915 RepID=A0A076L9I9_9EURY|nr:glucose-6-phosphate isomerase [Methanocaldococcus bathoardescens]AIJ04881.1 glucose-6-phosphate isomerase [Methanocaldococcus bathoardescens]
MLSYDYKNALNIGEISFEDINKVDFANAYSKLMEKLDNGAVGFRDVIYNENLDKYKFLNGYKNVVVVGMGGSILGTMAIYYAISAFKNNAYFIDNSDPEKTLSILKKVDLNESIIYIISKSGNTLETLVNYYLIKKRIEKLNSFEGKIVFITNGGKLKREAEKNNYEILSIPENVPGRFSVFTAVGLAPLCSLGIDISKILKGAREMDKICQNEDILKNPALLNGVIHYLYDKKGKDISVVMSYIESLKCFGEWYIQLIGESLGKEGNGLTPLLSIGAKDQHSLLQLYMDGKKDKIITFITTKNYRLDEEIVFDDLNDEEISCMLSDIIKCEQEATEIALTNNGVPNVKITLDEINEMTMGALLYMYEMQVGFMGELYNVNSYNQPAVEEEKKICWELIKKCGNYGNK